MTSPFLLGDIGGTNVRLALAEPGEGPGPLITIAAADHDSLADAVRAGLAALDASEAPRQAAFALAGPVTGDDVRLTNRPGWAVSAAALCRRLGLDRLTLVNDLAALALALPALGPGDTMALGGPEAPGDAAAPCAVLGPGTGFGVAALVRCGDNTMAVAGEGGHVGLAAQDDEEAALLARLRALGLRPSPDRVLSGPGLSLLYAVIAGIGIEAAPESRDIAYLSRTDPVAAETLARFARWLGAFAGDVTLIYGARGGAYIGGGVVPALGEAFPAATFRAGFEDKGRFRGYLAAIPTRLVVAEGAVLAGALAAAGRTGAGILTIAAEG